MPDSVSVPVAVATTPDTNSQPADSRRFGGITRLYGDIAMNRFQRAHVCVIGIGGVGSWVVEALARSAIGCLTLIDMDHVAESNINRQIHADSDSLGKAKIDAMAQRVNRINEACRLVLVDDFVSVENAAELLLSDYDFVVDCADNFRVKAEIVARCRRGKLPIITIGGAGGRIDPSAVRIADLSRTEHDPLLSKVRKQLRARYGFSRNLSRRFDVPCVYSSEQMIFPLAGGGVCRDKSRADTATGLSCAGGLGSATHVTAGFGFAAVAYVLKRLATQSGEDQ